MMMMECEVVPQEVDQGVGVLAPLAKDLVSRLDMNLQDATCIANLKLRFKIPLLFNSKIESHR